MGSSVQLDDGIHDGGMHGGLVQLHFMLPYETQWGQNVVISGARGLLGGGDVRKGIRMECTHEAVHGLVWQASMTVPSLYDFSYTYVVVNDREEPEVITAEAEQHHLSVPACSPGTTICVNDTFQAAGDPETIFKTSAFQSVIFGGKRPAETTLPQLQASSCGDVTVRFCIKACAITGQQAVHVYGNIVELGNWQEAHAVRMTETSARVWSCDVAIPAASFPFSYRYVVCDAADWQNGDADLIEESGEPRAANLSTSSSSGVVPMALVLNDGHFKSKDLWRGSGVVVPVFSLRTRASLGCGEFMDCKKMVDFVSACGIRVLQVLPVNDTTVFGTWWDSYPYSSVSVFALHPIYLSLQHVLGDAEVPTDIADMLGVARAEVAEDALVDMDYERTLAHKLLISRCIYDSDLGAQDVALPEFCAWVVSNPWLSAYKKALKTHIIDIIQTTRLFNDINARDVASPEFRAWVASNPWLSAYAAFNFLRDLFGTADHRNWGALGTTPADHIAKVTHPSQEYHPTIVYTYWLQWHLHKQLLEVSQYAAARRVVLKGDLPIGIDKASVDTWVDPHLFRMDVGVGSPPDAFDPNGQNWGFPGYKWDEMAKDGYAWWRTRLSHMAQYFSAFRVDHILGFFRIYEVPDVHVTGALGHFRPSLPLWKSDLEAHGLWDLNRLTEPYITRELVREHLGALADDAAAKYLEPTPSGMLRFKEAWRNEREIAAIAARSDAPPWQAREAADTRRGLLQLRQNVILLRDTHDATCFYPRFELSKTSSFATFDHDKHGLLTQLHDDYFYRSQDAVWTANAHKIIPALMGSTDMLMCGEDLGFVPRCVPPVMHDLGVIGLRIQRMPGSESPIGSEFGDPACYSYLTVASPACHDTTSTRAWYESDANRRERFYYRCLEGAGRVPDTCTPAIMYAVAKQHMASPAVFCILPIQDWLALSSRYTDRPANEETINDPTNKRHYWRYRMHHLLDDLLADTALIGCIQQLHLASGRADLKDLEVFSQ